MLVSWPLAPSVPSCQVAQASCRPASFVGSATWPLENSASCRDRSQGSSIPRFPGTLPYGRVRHPGTKLGRRPRCHDPSVAHMHLIPRFQGSSRHPGPSLPIDLGTCRTWHQAARATDGHGCQGRQPTISGLAPSSHRLPWPPALMGPATTWHLHLIDRPGPLLKEIPRCPRARGLEVAKVMQAAWSRFASVSMSRMHLVAIENLGPSRRIPPGDQVVLFIEKELVPG